MQRTIADEFEVGKRIFKDRIGNSAPDPKRFSIRSDSNAVRGGVQAHLGGAIPAGVIGEFHSIDFHMLGEIDDGKSVDVGKLHEDALRGAVGVCFECHGAHAVVELDLPCHLVVLEIDDRCGFGLDGAGNGIFPVGRDINVVDASVDGNGFCAG